PGVVKPFAGADVFSPSSLPAVDLLLITHDHYDHLDLRVINALKGRVGRVVTALGVGAHFERWGWPADLVTELEWWESAQPLPGVDITFTPSLHFSGRSLKRNQTLWGGFMLDVKGWRGYFSGDGGIGPHFADVAERFPNIQFAALEDGQYNVDWADIHLMPDDWGRAARTLRADYTMPCHNAKYDLSVHRWIDPLNAAYDEARKNDVRLVLPRIGERLALSDLSGHEAKWWPEKP
ncbi:MAG TPA: MBL fold metallo-hydrolase, partial [Candidatus Sutterella merdavium]|nr:MBL fold metallo-hydrolase [Candidatus Sutterella merdavium]